MGFRNSKINLEDSNTFVRCPICGKARRFLNWIHYKMHGVPSLSEMLRRYPHFRAMCDELLWEKEAQMKEGRSTPECVEKLRKFRNSKENRRRLANTGRKSLDALWSSPKFRREHAKRNRTKARNFWGDPIRSAEASIASSKRMIARCKDPNSGVGYANLWKTKKFQDAHHNAELGHGTHGTHISPKAGRVRYRSTWELEAYQILDSAKNVMKYEVEPFCIEYEWIDDKARKHWPDILIHYRNGKSELVEVKCWARMLFDEKSCDLEIFKMQIAALWCLENSLKYSVWSETSWPELDSSKNLKTVKWEELDEQGKQRIQ